MEAQKDFKDLLALLNEHNVEFMIGGQELWYDNEEGPISFSLEFDGGKVIESFDLESGSTISHYGQNAIVLFEENEYSFVCLVFSESTQALEDLIDSYNIGDSSRFCTTLGTGTSKAE